MKLDKMIADTTEGLSRESSDVKEIVLLFDEAQNLLTDDAFLFRCICWWLRFDRHNHVVAVFTGTSSGLANFYRDPPKSSTSRDGDDAKYGAGTGGRIRAPFAALHTIGLFAYRDIGTEKDATWNGPNRSEYHQAIPYGRPLFALLQRNKPQEQEQEQEQEHDLSPKQESAVLNRMLLSQRDWRKSDRCLLSILGTRIQLGTTSMSVVSDLVKSGYANLTYYSQEASMALMSFPPDPVCARLAMCMMGWRLGITRIFLRRSEGS